MQEIAGTYKGIDGSIYPYEKPYEIKYNKDIKSLMSSEYEVLQKLLEETRKCQTTYFWSSLTTSGILMTLGVRLMKNSSDIEKLCIPSMAILLVICPVWCIWFDKASSITRITAYLRVLEDIIHEKKQYIYIGWENSYAIFRYFLMDWYNNPENKDTITIGSRILCTFRYCYDGIKICLRFKQPHQYDILNWLGFFSVSTICIFILITSRDLLYILIFSTLYLFTIAFTSRVLSELSTPNNVNAGSRSTYRRELIWRYILNAKMFDKNGDNYIHIKRKQNFDNKQV